MPDFCQYGAFVEKGVITAASTKMDDDVQWNVYKVKSLSRPNCDTNYLPELNNKEYDVGQQVYFCLIGNGKGLVLCKVPSFDIT